MYYYTQHCKFYSALTVLDIIVDPRTLSDLIPKISD